MKELSKSVIRRQRDPKFTTVYFKGSGIDIGGKPDPLSIYKTFFPLITEIKVWDLEDGDAQHLEKIPDKEFDFVHSSHTLEHMIDPFEALQNWVRVTKPGGYLIVTIPDEDLYEQGIFEEGNKFNRHHNRTFTIFKTESWSSRSTNVIDLVKSVSENTSVEKIELIDSGYRYNIPRFDQTRTPVSESAIEFILRRKTSLEIQQRGRLNNSNSWDHELKAHLDQYVLDQKAAAERYPYPFGETK